MAYNRDKNVAMNNNKKITILISLLRTEIHNFAEKGAPSEAVR